MNRVEQTRFSYNDPLSFSPDNRFIATPDLIIDLEKDYYFDIGQQSDIGFLYEDIAIDDSGKMTLIDKNAVAFEYQLPNESGYTDTSVPLGSFHFVGNYLVSFGEKGSASGYYFSIIDCDSKKIVQQYDTILRYFISAPDLIIFQDSDFTTRIFDTKSGTIVKELGMKEEIGDIQCSADGKWIAIMGRYGHIDMIDHETNETIWDVDVADDRFRIINTFHTYGFFPDSNYLWVLGAYQEEAGVRIYDTSGNLVAFTVTYGVYNGGEAAFLSPDGMRMVLSVNGQFILWNMDAEKRMQKITELIGRVDDFDDRYFVTVYGDAAYVYDWDTAQFVSTIEGSNISDIQLLDDGFRAIVCDDSGVSIYDTATGQKVTPLCRSYGFEAYPANRYAYAAAINDGSEIAVIHYIYSSEGNGGVSRSYLMTFPYLNTFGEVYAEALQQLHGRTFDSDQDLKHIR